MRVRRIVTCGPPRSTEFFRIISYAARFAGEGGLQNVKFVFWVSLQLWSETFLREYLGLEKTR